MPKVTGGNALIDPQVIIQKAGIAERMHVGDLGCGGTGHFVFPVAASIGKNGIVYAVDILKNNLATIERRAQQENLQQVRTVWSNLEIFKATKIETGSLDVSLLINILYQSDQRAEIIREAVRLTKQQGRVVIVDWNTIAAPFGPTVTERLNKENLKKIGERLGLELVEEFAAGEYHFGMVFVKH